MAIAVPGVVETVDFDLANSAPNISVDQIRAQIAASIRRGHPQMMGQTGVRPERVVLLGSGPSLADHEADVRDLLFDGAKLVTCNGSYEWALAHNFRPSAQVILDARPENVRFLRPAIPQCAYLLASQCHADLWDAVADRPQVWIFHPVGEDQPSKDILDVYYQKRWSLVQGGCTVITRALWLMRMQGYVRFELFGVDSCWRGDRHHAIDQPENDRDNRYLVTIEPPEAPDLARTFACSLWHLKQFEDMMSMIKHLGDQFLLRVWGDGLLAHAIQVAANLETMTVRQE